MNELEDSSLLLSRGIRPTRQRTRVYEALLRCECHPTAEELHRKILGPVAPPTAPPEGDGVGADEPISLATVYNALQTLTEKGLVRPIHTIDGRRWDAGMHDHVHVYVDGAREVIDLPHDLGERLFECIPRELLAEVGVRLGMTVDRVSMQLSARRDATR